MPKLYPHAPFENSGKRSAQISGPGSAGSWGTRTQPSRVGSIARNDTELAASAVFVQGRRIEDGAAATFIQSANIALANQAVGTVAGESADVTGATFVAGALDEVGATAEYQGTTAAPGGPRDPASTISAHSLSGGLCIGVPASGGRRTYLLPFG